MPCSPATESIGPIAALPPTIRWYGALPRNAAVELPSRHLGLVQAAELAGVHEFARLHPKGYELQVGERGQNLSGGQRQNVALARALLLDPPILLLDEPTSAMDNTGEERLKQRLSAVIGTKTLLLVTHRASMLSLVDRLIIVDRGQIIADGPKGSVMEALKKGQISVS